MNLDKQRIIETCIETDGEIDHRTSYLYQTEYTNRENHDIAAQGICDACSIPFKTSAIRMRMDCDDGFEYVITNKK